MVIYSIRVDKEIEMATLHRIPVMQGDVEGTFKAGNLLKCQWCNKEVQPEDTMWECVGNLDHFLVCDDCHESAIIH